MTNLLNNTIIINNLKGDTMNKNHFNVWEFKQALELGETDPISARVLYEEYFKKYPKDYSGYPYYCSNLITLGELELAEKIL